MKKLLFLGILLTAFSVYFSFGNITFAASALSISADNTDLPAGGSTKLHYDFSACSSGTSNILSDDTVTYTTFSPTLPDYDYFIKISPIRTTTYVLSCGSDPYHPPASPASASATVNVAVPAGVLKPSARFSIVPATVLPGDLITLKIDDASADTSCTITANGTVVGSSNGSYIPVHLYETTTYVATCKDKYGQSVAYNATATVSNPDNIPVVKISAAPTSGTLGSDGTFTSTISWTATNNPTRCGWIGELASALGAVTSNTGSQKVLFNNPGSYVFGMSCSNKATSDSTGPASSWSPVATVLVTVDGTALITSNQGSAQSGSISARTLRLGLQNDPDVVTLQNILRERGYFSGESTGDFLESTRQAVISFQIAHGLTADGIVGPQTRAALLDNSTVDSGATDGASTTSGGSGGSSSIHNQPSSLVSFTAMPAVIAPGESSTLTLTYTSATSCSGPSVSYNKNYTTSTVQPSQTTTYTVICYFADHSPVTSNVTVTVDSNASPTSSSSSTGSGNPNGSTDIVPGCGIRTTGFSGINGLSCANNSPSSYEGCDGRNTGFSSHTGVSCTAIE